MSLSPNRSIQRLFLATLLGSGLPLPPARCSAQLQILPQPEPQSVFAGDNRAVSVSWHNPNDTPLHATLHTRVYQASSATAAPWAETPWKQLDILPGQTVLDTARFSFPAIHAETRFLIQWVQNTNTLAGITEVLVYPTNLLHELQPLAGGEPLGVLDPNHELQPLLSAAAVEWLDLEKTGLDPFHGKLAIIRPFESPAPLREGLAAKVKALAQKGLAVVWIQAPPEGRGELLPTFYTVPHGKGAIVVVQAGLVAGLASKPRAQLHLIHCARLALHPQPPALPDLALQP